MGPEILMLHTKFHGNPPTGCGDDDFLSFYHKYGHDSHLGDVTLLICINVHFLAPISSHMNFDFKWLHTF